MPLPRPSGTRHHRSRYAIHPSGTRARLPRHTADLRQMALDGLSNGVAARHVIGRLLDLLHISWQTCAHISCRITRGHRGNRGYRRGYRLAWLPTGLPTAKTLTAGCAQQGVSCRST